MAKGTLTVRVISDTAAAEKGIERFGQKVETTGQKLSRAGDKMTMFATVPIAAAMGLAANAASNLEQSVGGVESVFGEARRPIEQFGETAAETAGLSKRQVNEMAAVIGASLQGLGFDAGEAATTVVDLEKRAADMAATFGGTTEEAIESVASALRGERDPIEKYGVSLKQADINARVLAMGLDTSTTASKKKSEAIAALDLIMGQTAKTEGQFAREADGAAGSMQIAKAEMENASAEIGSALLPLVAQAAGGVADLARGFADLPGPVQKGVLAIAGLVAVAGPVASVGGRIMNIWPKIGPALDRASIGAYNLAGGLGKIGAAAGGVAALYVAGEALDATVNKLNRANLSTLQQSILDLAETGRVGGAAADAFGEDLGGLSNALERVTDPSIITQADHAINTISTFGGLLGRGKGDLEQAKATIDDLDKALASLATQNATAAAQALENLKASLGPEEYAALLPLLNDYQGALADIDVAARSGAGGIGDMNAATTNAQAPTETLTTRIDEEKAAADRLQEALDRVKEATDELIGANISAEEATLRAEEAHATLTETLIENGATLDIHSEKGRANREAILGTANAALDHVEALKEQGASTDEVNFFLSAHVERLKETMRQAGLTEGEIDNYIKTLGLTPKNIATIVELNGVAEAEAALDNLTRLRRVQIQAQVSGARTAGPQVRHQGGPVSARSLYLVGRPGHEELFVPEQSGRIISGPSTDRMLRSAGGRSSVSVGGGDMSQLASLLEAVVGRLDVIAGNTRPGDPATARALANARVGA